MVTVDQRPGKEHEVVPDRDQDRPHTATESPPKQTKVASDKFQKLVQAMANMPGEQIDALMTAVQNKKEEDVQGAGHHEELYLGAGHQEEEDSQGTGHHSEKVSESSKVEPWRGVKTKMSSKSPVCQLVSPFSIEIESTPPGKGFKMPKIATYTGDQNPYDHMHCYISHMDLFCQPEAMKCKAFPALLSGRAREWFNNLPPRSITSFESLTNKFCHAFVASKPFHKNRTHLLSIKQQKEETVLEYMKKFNQETALVADVDDRFLVSSFIAGLSHGRLYAKLTSRDPATMEECLEISYKFCQGDEANRLKREEVEKQVRGKATAGPSAPAKRKSVFDRVSAPKQEPASKRPYWEDRDLVPLNRSKEQVLQIMQRRGLVRNPPPLKGPREKRNPQLFCQHHKDIGHETEQCQHLTKEINRVAQEGKINDVLANTKGGQKKQGWKDDHGQEKDQQRRRDRSPEPDQGDKNREGHYVNTITGQMGGPKITANKESGRTVSKSSEGSNPGTSRTGVKEETSRAGGKRNDISRPDESSTERKFLKMSGTVVYGPDDPLPTVINNEGMVIDAVINKNRVSRVCVDTGSGVNILYHHTYEKMKFMDMELVPVATPLFGFAGPPIHSAGMVRLLTTFGYGQKTKTIETNYLIVRANSAYNVILGRPALIELRAILSPAHNSMKIPMAGCPLLIKGDVEAARSCYAVTMSGKMVHQITMEEILPEAEQTWLTEDLVDSVLLVENEQDSSVSVGKWMPSPQKAQLIALLKEFKDVFAWRASDVPGLPVETAVHRLNIDASKKPIKQKKRSFGAERMAAIKAEVDKLLQANIIREVIYPEWIANPVLVKKHDGSWRMCVDFTDLNKACPKDSYATPRIDRLVDSTVGFEIFAFLDAYKGYHQISMHPEDAVKTAFITEFGTFYYVSMPFGLKNAGATYQRAVSKIFDKQLGRNVEAYIDDLLVKSRTLDQYLADVSETLTTLRSSRMKLNPKKCTFGVRSGKFLGYMISKEGIRANPDQLRAITEMPTPKGVKDIQRLTGRLAALNRFLSKSAQKSLPFFKILRKASPFNWDEQCEKAFADLKEHITQLPTLTSPQEGEKLYLYLAVCKEAISAVLLRKQGSVERAVYFVSKALQGAETRYSEAEQVVLALVHASRKLRSYFQCHPIEVLTNHPIKQILHNPDRSSRVAKWVAELAEFELDYKPRNAIKAQALADFLAEEHAIQLQPAQDAGKLEMWKLYVDGASSRDGSGAGMLLISPKGEEFPYALHFQFKATNNEAEYEALVTGLNLATKLGVKNLTVLSDSQLVVNQIKGEYEASEGPMKKYLAVAQKKLQLFDSVAVEQISRTDNGRADALSKLGSNFLSNKRVLVESLETRSYENLAVLPVSQEPTWMDPIHIYLKYGIHPVDRVLARKIIRIAPRYALYQGQLYRKSYVQPWLKCVTEEDGRVVMDDIHSGLCGSHIGSRALARKCRLFGYYWPQMHAMAVKMVQECHTCQVHANVTSRPIHEEVPIVSPWPFDQWGIDLIGPLPKGTGGVQWIVVAIDYFTRWVEAETLASITAQQITKFIWQNILCRYGVPKVIISDNGKQFEDHRVKAWCQKMGITQHFASVKYPQANGQVEQANRTLKAGLKKRLEKEGNHWVDHLPNVLWSYRTTINAATGETPFSLSYGCEAVIPAELGVKSPRMEAYTGPTEQAQEMLQIKEDLEEKREMAHIRAARYKQQMAQYYNAKVKQTYFKVGDLVLRNNLVSNAVKRKLGPKWEGPYRIVKIHGQGSYQLADAAGRTVPRNWNGKHLKKFYP